MNRVNLPVISDYLFSDFRGYSQENLGDHLTNRNNPVKCQIWSVRSGLNCQLALNLSLALNPLLPRICNGTVRICTSDDSTVIPLTEEQLIIQIDGYVHNSILSRAWIVRSLMYPTQSTVTQVLYIVFLSVSLKSIRDQIHDGRVRNMGR